MKTQKVKCNKGCWRSFDLLKIKPLVEVVAEEKRIERYYFKCPHCGVKYVCFYSDDIIRAWQKDLENTKEVQLREKIFLNIKARMDMLKQKYGG